MKMTGVHWDRVGQPKKISGIGIRKAKENNKALIMKLGWGLLTQPDKLWVQILKGKYVKDKGHPPVVITKPNASPL